MMVPVKWPGRRKWYGDCPACRHDWREHIPPDPCSECQYEIDHEEPNAPVAPCPLPAPPPRPADTAPKTRHSARGAGDRVDFVYAPRPIVSSMQTSDALKVSSRGALGVGLPPRERGVLLVAGA